jgi:ParB family chromosome partitioning protein
VAHHLTLLALPPVLDIALQTGRCSSPRTLYELTKLHANQPERVTELVTGSEPITRGAVAQIRDAALLDSSAMGPSTLTQPRSDRAAQFLANANRLCERLDAALLRLSRAGAVAGSSDDMAALRQRVAGLASRLSA